MLIPAWVRMSGKTAVVLDGRRVGAGIFAAYFEGPLTRRALLHKVGMGMDEGISVFLFGSLQPMNDEQREPPSQGGLILFLRRGEVPEWATELEDRLTDPTRWRPEVDHPQHLPGRHIEFQGEEQTFLHQLDRNAAPDPQRMADHAFGAHQGEVWLRAPTQRPMRMYARGKRVHSIIAVLSAARYPRDNTKVVFLDTRPIGLWPQWVAIPGDLLDPGAYAEGLQIPYIEGYSLIIKGGQRHRDGVRIRVLDGEVIEFLLKRSDEVTPTSSSLEPDSSDDDDDHGGDDGDDNDHPMPNSSDFSDPSPPAGEGPYGPPPPRPVNEERSRSPRREDRNHGGQPGEDTSEGRHLRLSDHVPLPVYDLTDQYIPLPHNEEDLWALCKPWGNEWIVQQIPELNWHPATASELHGQMAWSDLLAANSGEHVELCLYTDGSADLKAGQSGYAVTILLKIGAAAAVFGILGGQLHGNEQSLWEETNQPSLGAEQVALAAALLWILQLKAMLQNVKATISYDCYAAGKAADGQWEAPNELGIRTFHLYHAITALPGIELEMNHVKGHSGHPWNEMADCIARTAAKDRDIFVGPPPETIHTFLKLQLQWLAPAIKAAKDGALPVRHGYLQWSGQPFHDHCLAPNDIIPVQEGGADVNGQNPAFRTRAATINIQGISGNHRYIEEQLNDLGVNLVFMQETKERQGMIRGPHYLRFSTESERHFGVAIWIHRTMGLLNIDGETKQVEEQNVVTLLQGPRILALKITLQEVKIALIASHCPHAGRAAERDAHLQELKKLAGQAKNMTLVVIGTDLNGRLPPNYRPATGPLEFDEPDRTGEIMADIMAEQGHPRDAGAQAQKQQLLYNLMAAAIKVVTARIKKTIMAAKNDFLSNIAAEAMPLLEDPRTGQPAEAAGDRDRIWLEHFGKQELGTVEKVTDFIKVGIKGGDPEDVQWTCQLLPDIYEVAKTMRAVPKGRTAGLDNIPSDVLARCPCRLAEAVHPLFVKSLLGGTQPLQWRGGILYEAYKGSGLQSQVDNFRSLFISSFLGKSLHKALRNKIQQQVESFLHPLHFGSRRHSPVMFPALFVASHLRRCKAQKLSASVLFIDSRSAYYRLARELATGPITSDTEIVKIFRMFGLQKEDLDDLMEEVTNGGMLRHAGVPEAIQKATGDFYRMTWWVTKYSNGELLCHAKAGSRPGEAWADVLFAFIYTRVLYRIHEHLEGEGILFKMPLDKAAGVHPPGRDTTLHDCWDTTWADDTALLTGAGAKKARRKTFGSGKAELWLADLQEAVPVVQVYKHLGGMVDGAMTMSHEVRYRMSMAAAAFESAKKLILQNERVALQVRGRIFEATVTPTIFNIALWTPEGKQWEKLSDGYSRQVRRLLGRQLEGPDLFRLPLSLAHWATGCWPLYMIAKRARLSLLVSLCKAGPDALWAMIQLEGTWCQQALLDLRWLVEGLEDQWPATRKENWPEWWHLLRGQGQRVKRVLKKKMAKDFEAYKRQEAERLCLWGLSKELDKDRPGAQPDVSWRCRPCAKGFGSRAALSVHFFAAHGRIARYRKHVRGTKCAACAVEFWTTGRLEDHLRASGACVDQLEDQTAGEIEIQPGYGSRQRRQNEAANFTPAAAPSGGTLQSARTRTIQHPGEAMRRNEWEEALYKGLSDLLIGEHCPGHEVELRSKIREGVNCHPLYPEEFQKVIDTILEEAASLQQDPDLSPWGARQYEVIVEALTESYDPGEADANDQKIETALPYADFKKHIADYDWQRAIHAHRQGYETHEESLFELGDDWEAAWHRQMSGLKVAAVARDLCSLLPRPLQDAWRAFRTRKDVRIRAPDNFWCSTLSRPFGPFRELACKP
ncbi:Pol [Symbiodinium sp. CCMP2456]|nr:Pol [Symbiodinium sp. CCMP2456]